MGRSNKGKKQEEAQLDANQKQQAHDTQVRDTQIGMANKATDSLEANPGFTQPQMTAMQAENAGIIHGLYGSAGNELTNHAAVTGHANDAGLYSQLDNLQRQRAMATAQGQNSIQRMNANAALDTRRMLPGFRMNPAGVMQQNISSVNGNNAQMIGNRMSADNAPTFLQQAALAGISAAGNTFTKAL